jgi:hypothetical protein
VRDLKLTVEIHYCVEQLENSTAGNHDPGIEPGQVLLMVV